MRTHLLAAGAVALAIVVATTGQTTLGAQAPPAADPASLTFDVASVKPNKSGDGRIMIGAPNGRFTATNAPLRELVRIAYQLQPFQLVGGPDWMTNNRFDIVAKSPVETAPIGPPGAGAAGPMQYMLRNLLADRFKLKVHTETRDMPIYALVLARSDGKLGPQLQKASVDCAAMRGRARGGPPPAGPPAPPQPGERPPCGMFMGFGSIAAGGVSMTQLASTLSQRVGRTVVDRTGLVGAYEFNVDFTPDQLPQGGGAPPGGGPPLVNGAAIDPNGPSIFTAVQEQLGLKLESQRGPVEVLVIDSVEQPTAD